MDAAGFQPKHKPKRSSAARDASGNRHASEPAVSANGGRLSAYYALPPTVSLGAVQTKLTVGTVGDPYEREADAVADSVVQGAPVPEVSFIPAGGLTAVPRRKADNDAEDRALQMSGLSGDADAADMQDATLQSQAVNPENEDTAQTQLIQRIEEEQSSELAVQTKCERCKEAEAASPHETDVQKKAGTADRPIQRKGDRQETLQADGQASATTPATPVAAVAQNAIQSGGPGTAMSFGTRQRIESSLGQDLSDVRVHEDSNSHSANVALRSRAFTHGNHIWLGQGESQNDLGLIAHETAHVLQQGAVVRRKPRQTGAAAVDSETTPASAPTRSGSAAPSPVAPVAAPAVAAPRTAGGGAAASPSVQAAPSSPVERQSAAPVDQQVAASVVESAGPAVAAGAGPDLLMSEPPQGLSAAEQARVTQVEDETAEAGAAQEELPSADENVAEAREAVEEPSEETAGRAGGEVASELGGMSPPSPEVEALCSRILTLIRNRQPPSEAAVLESDPEQEAAAAGAAVAESVEGDVERTQSSYDRLEQQPEGEASREASDIETPPEQVAAPTIDAESATPDAVPSEDVSLDADVEASQNRLEEAGMNSEPAQLVESGPIAEARAAQGELAETAQRAPQEVLSEHQAARDQAAADLAALRDRASASLQTSRTETIGGTVGQQQAGKQDEETQRRQAGQRAQQIFESAQSRVNELLEPLPRTAMSLWERGVQVLNTEYDQAIERIQNRLRERYEGVSGAVLEFAEDIVGKPAWVTEGYNSAELSFGEGACELIRSISSEVNTVIDSCQAIIDDANTQIENLFASLPESLQAWAQGQRAQYAERLDGLRNRVATTQADFTRDLVRTAGQAVQQMRERTQELRDAARGLLGRIEDAINAFIEDPAKFIIEGLLELVGIPPASFWALVDRIGQVINDIADNPLNFANNLAAALGQGFQKFFDNFKDHILGGFFDWLFSGLGAVGVQIPSDFSLSSLITFFLQLMGITWARIREILARHIGEENVALLEKAYELIATLMERGVDGIFEMIREQLNPQTILSAVLDAAIDFLIEALIRAVTPRIIAMFNPAGAIVQAIEVIYRILAWIFNNAARIFSLVETIVNGAADLIAGNTSGMATAVEGALSRLIAPVIDFLAGFLGLGSLPDRIADTIRGFQEMVLGVIDRVVAWLAQRARGLLQALGIGGETEENSEEANVDFTDHRAVADQAKRELQGVAEGEEGYDQVRSAKEEQARQIERRYSPRLEEGIALRIIFVPRTSDQEDQDIDFNVEIAPNTTTVPGSIPIDAESDDTNVDELTIWEAAAASTPAHIQSEPTPVTRLDPASAQHGRVQIVNIFSASNVSASSADSALAAIDGLLARALEETSARAIEMRFRSISGIANRVLEDGGTSTRINAHHTRRVEEHPGTFRESRTERMYIPVAIRRQINDWLARHPGMTRNDDDYSFIVSTVREQLFEQQHTELEEPLEWIEMVITTRAAHEELHRQTD